MRFSIIIKIRIDGEISIDNIKDRVSIDLLRINGNDFSYFDKRLLSLYLVKHQMTTVSMFDENKKRNSSI